jgi:hypothetical protein
VYDAVMAMLDVECSGDNDALGEASFGEADF